MGSTGATVRVLAGAEDVPESWRIAASTAKTVDEVYTDLTGPARRSGPRRGPFMGDTKGGPFDVPGRPSARVAAGAR